MKNLYVLVSDGGDGSYNPQYTMNTEWIKKQDERSENRELEYGVDIGVDGDGFHYDTLTVGDDVTLESLGIHYDCADND